MIKRKYSFLVAIIIILLCFLPLTFSVSAKTFDESVDEQLNILELSDLEDFYNQNLLVDGEEDFGVVLSRMLSGEFNLDAKSIFEYALNIFSKNLIDIMPTLISIVAIAVFCGVMNNIKSNTLGDSTVGIVNYVAVLAVAIILSVKLTLVFNETKIVIENITKLVEIMSPIILTLMVASGGKVSAAMYKPVVAMLSGGIANVITYAVLPMIGVTCVFCVLADISPLIKLKKFSDFFASVIKWIIGFITVIFGFFVTVQGIGAANFDGLSLKATKYAISNGVPIIGGFLGGGFDVVVAGSVLIKNSIGLVVVFAMFFKLLSPITLMASFNLMLKLIASITEPVSDAKIPEFCINISKCIVYLMVALLLVGLMFFVTVLLMIFSANSFVV